MGTKSRPSIPILNAGATHDSRVSEPLSQDQRARVSLGYGDFRIEWREVANVSTTDSGLPPSHVHCPSPNIYREPRGGGGGRCLLADKPLPAVEDWRDSPVRSSPSPNAAFPAFFVHDFGVTIRFSRISAPEKRLWKNTPENFPGPSGVKRPTLSGKMCGVLSARQSMRADLPRGRPVAGLGFTKERKQRNQEPRTKNEQPRTNKNR